MKNMELREQGGGGRSRIRNRPFVVASLIVVAAWAGPVSAQEVKPDYDFYRGKTIDLMVTNAAGTTMGNTFAALHDAFERTLGASVRMNYNSGVAVAALNAAASQPADGLHLGAMAIPTAQSNAIYGTGLTFDLRDLAWIGASYGDMNAVWACGTPQWTSWDEFMKSNDSLRITSVYGGSAHLTNLALVRALGRDYKMLTGYTGKDIAVSCTRGDANWKVSAAANYTNSAGTGLTPGALPLLLSGEAPEGSPMKFLNQMAPTLADWAKTYTPATEDQKKMLDIAIGMFSTDVPYEAMFAPAGVRPEQLAALREAFGKAVVDPAVQEGWLKIGLQPNRYFAGDDIDAFLRKGSDVQEIRRLLDITPNN